MNSVDIPVLWRSGDTWSGCVYVDGQHHEASGRRTRWDVIAALEAATWRRLEAWRVVDAERVETQLRLW